MSTFTPKRGLQPGALILFVGRKPVLRIERDHTHRAMWRIRLPGGGLSDIANIARIKDAALDMAEGIEARKTPHKLPLKSLTNFHWVPSPVEQDEASGNPASSAVAEAAE
jgi:hypothetical protein